MKKTFRNRWLYVYVGPSVIFGILYILFLVYILFN